MQLREVRSVEEKQLDYSTKARDTIYTALLQLMQKKPYEKITITLHLQDSVSADQITLTQGGSPLEKTVIDEHTVSVTFDAATCAAWQEAALNESFRMYVFCKVDS